MARTGPIGLAWQCPLFGVDRKSHFGAVRSAFDPGCVKTLPSNFHIEAQSQSCQSESKYCWQPQPRDDDRENHSVRPPLSRVFTQPGPGTDLPPRGTFRGEKRLGEGHVFVQEGDVWSLPQPIRNGRMFCSCGSVARGSYETWIVEEVDCR